jgi:hypothetical protein
VREASRHGEAERLGQGNRREIATPGGSSSVSGAAATGFSQRIVRARSAECTTRGLARDTARRFAVALAASRRTALALGRVVISGEALGRLAHGPDTRRRRRAFEDHADDDLTVAIHLVEHAGSHALRLEDATDGGLQLDDEEIHTPICD